MRDEQGADPNSYHELNLVTGGSVTTASLVALKRTVLVHVTTIRFIDSRHNSVYAFSFSFFKSILNI